MVSAMQVIAARQAAPPSGSVLGGTIFGSASVGVGLALAYLALGTPLVSRVGPSVSAASSAGIVVGIWAFSVIAGGAFVVSGTDRLPAGPAPPPPRAPP